MGGLARSDCGKCRPYKLTLEMRLEEGNGYI